MESESESLKVEKVITGNGTAIIRLKPLAKGSYPFVVMAASRGVPGRGRAVALGLLAGIAGSAVIVAIAALISAAFEGRGLELFTVAVLLTAGAMLTLHDRCRLIA